MNRTVITAMVFAASAALGAAAYAQDAHNHDTAKSAPAASQNQDTPCCKPGASEANGVHDMAGYQHDHAQTPKKPAAKKSARKPAADANQNTR